MSAPATERGGRLEHPPSPVAEGVRLAVIVDPEGTTYEVVEVKITAED